MDRSLFRFILRYSKWEQLRIAPLVLGTMIVYFLTLDLPKTIINEAIQGRRFPTPESTAPIFRVVIQLPQFLGGSALKLSDGIPLERIPYLFALSLIFMGLIIFNGALKFQINTMKGWMGERMLRRLRFVLLDYILRFPLARFRRIKSAELATMIKDEVEPLGGFIGEAFISPLFLGGQALTAVVFILYQHLALGMIAVVMVSVQAVLIPKMRRRLIVLAGQRQLQARHLAGRIGECVDGVVEIHAHDTSNYERAEMSSRLGVLFRTRFEYYQRKFLTKFVNNLLAQVTPFLFYTIGGYLVIVGRLDIGALVAVIAAYKDLPDPVKELIDWDQERLDVTVKYVQVIEQFTVDDIIPPEVQRVIPTPELPRQGSIVASNLTLNDDSGTPVLSGVSFEVPLDQHVAVLGDHTSGRTELAQLLTRLVTPTSGALEVGGVNLIQAPEAVTGRVTGYVGSASYLFPTSVRENLVYALKHYPVRERTYHDRERAEREFRMHEAKRTGNSLLDINADWIDYQSADVSTPQEMELRLHQMLATVELEETIFELGLRSTIDLDARPDLAEGLVRARQSMQKYLSEPGVQNLVEQFDPDRYIRNATLAENLLFGTPVGATFDIGNLASNAYVRKVITETGLAGDLLRMGHKVAESMVELFSGLPPGHEMFERFSFIREDDLPYFKDLLGKVSDVGLDAIDAADRDRLLGLSFMLIAARHRLGLIDEPLEARILVARRFFAENLPEEMRGAVEFFDPATCNRSLSLQDNILFGKVVTTQAGASASISRLLRQVLEQQNMRSVVISVGLDYQVGVGGARLPAPDRQKIAIARALMKRPTILVLDQAEAAMDPITQKRVITRILGQSKGRCVVWVLQRLELSELFDQVLVLQRGQVVEQGPYAELRTNGGALHDLISKG
jgi:putative ABC transport system ATP-binding protein